jgi:hypothetical protein
MLIAISVVGLAMVALLGAFALIHFTSVDPGRRSGPAQEGERDLKPEVESSTAPSLETWAPDLSACVCPRAPASSLRPTAPTPAREIVIDEFARRERLELRAWVVSQGWTEVPDLVAAICCPRDRAMRTPTQARAALAELYQDGLLDLELVSEREALGSGHRLSLFLPGPRGQYFGWARLARPKLAEEPASRAQPSCGCHIVKDAETTTGWGQGHSSCEALASRS